MIPHILVVDDDEHMQFFLKEALQRERYNVTVVGTAEDGIESIKNGNAFDLVLLDVRLPGMNGLDAVDYIVKLNAQLPVIIMTAHGTRNTAIDALKRGAYDYFTKPFRVDEIEIVIRRALEKTRLLGEIRRLRAEVAHSHGRDGIIGMSQAMQEVFHLIDRAAPTDSTVLITGESGTGKELIAKAIHERSPRRDHQFIKLNCAAIPETLLESELFGHEKGAFTGALGRKPGKFELADGGTLLLDEIGDMALSTQAKILRVLQERELERVGGTQTIRVDVRIIASTNKDLQRNVADGRFRDDLYFRLNVVTIHVPPLRERREEVPKLVDYFLAEANERLGRSIRHVAPDALTALMDYAWPGNVRELKNAIERATVVCDDAGVLTLIHLPRPIRPATLEQELMRSTSDAFSLDGRMSQLERAFVLDALGRAGGVQAVAARLLGVSERSVWHLVKKHKIEVDKLKERVHAGERA